MSNTCLDTSTPSPDEDQLLQRFADYTQYQSAFLATLGRAERQLLLCERSFAESPLGSLAAETLLADFLVRPGQPRIRLLCFDAHYLGSRCPRFLRLHERFGHAIEMRRLHDEGRPSWESGFIVADQQHYLQRHHFDWPKGETGTNSRTISHLQGIFEQLWQQASPDLAWQRLEI